VLIIDDGGAAYAVIVALLALLILGVLYIAYKLSGRP
jgi:cbb3-type cytochrome oxidase subunit 3